MPEVFSLQPLIDDNSEILILGTMPGEESLRLGQYYADPRNKFWDIVSNILGSEITDADYNDKEILLKKHRIALWDVLAHCIRDGGLDSNIKAEVPNDIVNILLNYPKMKCVLFNGRTAEKLFKKYNKSIMKDGRRYIALPSTSSTPGRHVKPYGLKVLKWKEHLNC